MDFISLFLLINTIVLSAALGSLVLSWRKVRSELIPRNRVNPATRYEPTRPGEIEKRAEKVMSDAQTFVFLGGVSNEEKESLKTHQYAFYAHYYTANVYLSQATFDSYMDQLNLAEKELAAMDMVLKDHWPSLKSQSPGHSLS